MASPFAVLGVPIDSAGVTGGTELAPAALRARGLADAVGGTDLGDLDVHIRGDRRHPVTGVLESDQVDAMTRAVRAAVAEVSVAGERPFLIGGCCAMVPGALAGCRDALGRIGIAHVDGHLDLYDGATSPGGEAADMPLTVALGTGPSSWVEAAGGPSVRPDGVWIVGHRDQAEAAADGSVLPADFTPSLGSLDAGEVRDLGPATAGAAVADSLAAAGGFWVHVDLDVADPAVFFANDAPVPDGLDWDELVDLLRPLMASPALCGVSLGCYNPEKDATGRNAAEIVDVMTRALAVV